MWMRVLIVLVALGAPRLEAQEASVPTRRLAIFITGGVPLGGPSAAAMDRMRETGYDDTQPYGCFIVFCGGPTDHPIHFRGVAGTLTVRYTLSRPWAISAGIGGGDLGSAMGYRADALGGLGTFIDSGQWSDAPLWVLVQRSLRERIRLGLGPSLHLLRRDEGTGVPEFTSTRIGLTTEATLELPRASRLFWVLTARGHWIPGSEDVFPSSFGALQPLRTTFSYLTVQTGFGFRL